MSANLLWLLIAIAGAAGVWFAPHAAAPVFVLNAWVFGTWWGYLTAYGEKS